MTIWVKTKIKRPIYVKSGAIDHICWHPFVKKDSLITTYEMYMRKLLEILFSIFWPVYTTSGALFMQSQFQRVHHSWDWLINWMMNRPLEGWKQLGKVGPCRMTPWCTFLKLELIEKSVLSFISKHITLCSSFVWFKFFNFYLAIDMLNG